MFGTGSGYSFCKAAIGCRDCHICSPQPPRENTWRKYMTRRLHKIDLYTGPLLVHGTIVRHVGSAWRPPRKALCQRKLAQKCPVRLLDIRTSDWRVAIPSIWIPLCAFPHTWAQQPGSCGRKANKRVSFLFCSALSTIFLRRLPVLSLREKGSAVLFSRRP